MRQVTLRWPLIGALVGALGWVVPCFFVLGAIENDAPVNPIWDLAMRVLCPTAIVLRGFWVVLVVNCFLYALLISGLRIAFFYLGHRRISN
jgi:hypothetical protein